MKLLFISLIFIFLMFRGGGTNRDFLVKRQIKPPNSPAGQTASKSASISTDSNDDVDGALEVDFRFPPRTASSPISFSSCGSEIVAEKIEEEKEGKNGKEDMKEEERVKSRTNTAKGACFAANVDFKSLFQSVGIRLLQLQETAPVAVRRLFSLNEHFCPNREHTMVHFPASSRVSE